VYRLSAAQKLVEIHKKYAISVACILFVLLGPPLAMRFPQGGLGMVIAASVGIFFVYWMGLIGGERFADQGQVNPVIAMWASNAVLLLSAMFFLWNVGRPNLHKPWTRLAGAPDTA
jgi:lipopolysaccharide export system permease protein